MGDYLIGTLLIVWMGAFSAVLAAAWGLMKWFTWRQSMLQRLLD
jgi:hypothetical protein